MLRPKCSGKKEGSSFRETNALRSDKDEGGGGGGDELLPMSDLASLSGDSVTGNVDTRLIDDLQDLLPLLESFLDRDRKVSSCFTRRGKMVCTKTPSKDSLSMKKGRRPSQSVPGKEQDILGEKHRRHSRTKDWDGGGDSSSLLSQKALEAEKDREEITVLKDQLEDLRQKLLEKEEILNAAEISRNQLTSAQEELNELQYQMREKDSMLKAFERQLSDAKIKLAERQAALEKIQWEAMTSNKQAEKLQGDLKTAELEMSAFTILLESLAKNENAPYTKDYDVTPNWMNHASEIVKDDIDELDLQKMEEARKAYLAALAAAKEHQDEESLAAVASARFHLQSFVLAF